MYDLAAFTSPVSDDLPAGENLEFDPDFGALERATQGKGEQQFGNTIVPAEEPDWKEAEALGLALLARTRDLRVLALLAVARLQLKGMHGFASVISCTRELLDGMWASLHPQLDPEDDNDPTLRSNALLRFGEPGRVLRVLRDYPLASSPRAGKISWRDIGYSNGTLELPPDREKPLESLIRGAFQEADQSKLAELRDDLQTAIADIAAIGAVFDREAGYGTGPDLGDLVKLLREMQKYMERYTPAAASATQAAEPDHAGEATGTAVVAQRESAGMSASGLKDISTREDAMRVLELVRAYYARYEPSSPLTFILDRARRLADKDFFDILQDIAPDGLGQAQLVMGVRPE